MSKKKLKTDDHEESSEGVKKQQVKEKISEKSQQTLATFFNGGQSFTVPLVIRGNAANDDFTEGKASIYCWNVNGVSATIEKGQFQSFMQHVNADVICLNETKTDPDKIDQKRLFQKIPSGYASYWNCSKAKLGYSGTAILTRVKPISVQFDFGKEHINEGRSITMEFNNFVLVAAYVPNAGEGLKRLQYRITKWDADFHIYLKQIEKERRKPVILTGDLNVAHNEIDLYDTKGKEKVPGYTPEERQSFGKLLDSGFVDTFRHLHPDLVKYTFWSAR